jgi:general secretion pathway protein K
VAVLWLSAALAAIAFSLATTVRGELERSTTQFDGTQAYYLAAGGLDRALVYMQWGPRFQEVAGESRYYSPRTPRLHFDFPAGEAAVEISPESSRINVNQAPPVEILRLLEALGVDRDRAVETTQAILDWRTVPADGGLTEFDRYYLSLAPSFPSRHASFLEKEELLLVKGMTPDLYYGSFERDAQGQLQPVGGLADCVTVFGDSGPVDVNTAPPAVLAAVGLSPREVGALVEARRVEPIRSVDVLRALGLPDPSLARLGVGGDLIYTLRATGRRRTQDGKMSDAVRSVGATVRLAGGAPEDACQILRWNEHLWVRDTL